MNTLATQGQPFADLDTAITDSRASIAKQIGAVLDTTVAPVVIPEHIQALLLEAFSDIEGVFYPEFAAKYLLASGALVSGFSHTTPFAILRSGNSQQIDLIAKNLGNMMAGNCA